MVAYEGESLASGSACAEYHAVIAVPLRRCLAPSVGSSAMARLGDGGFGIELVSQHASRRICVRRVS